MSSREPTGTAPVMFTEKAEDSSSSLLKGKNKRRANNLKRQNERKKTSTTVALMTCYNEVKFGTYSRMSAAVVYALERDIKQRSSPL